jgi:hypothetical protein
MINFLDNSPPTEKKRTHSRLAASRCTHDAIDEKRGQLRRERPWDK